MEQNNTSIKTKVPEENIFMFNQQGEIREIFDSDGMKPNKYLTQFYPEQINASKYRSLVEKDLQNLYECLENKFDYDKKVEELPSFNITVDEILDKSLTFVGTVKKIKITEIQKLIGHF